MLSVFLVLRGTIVNRTYGTHKNLDIPLFLVTILRPIYYGPPYTKVTVHWRLHVDAVGPCGRSPVASLSTLGGLQ